MTRLLLVPLLALVAAPAVAKDDDGFEKPAVAMARFAAPHVTVWLLPGHDRGRRRYGVVDRHDGQNVLFPARSGLDKVRAADKAVFGLAAARRIAPVIIVAIDHPAAACYGRYLPQRLYGMAHPATPAALAAQVNGPIEGDADLDVRLGPSAGRRWWMDHGERTLDADDAPWPAAIGADLIALGWREGRDVETCTYPGAAHEEDARAARLPALFAWLLG